VAEGRYAIRSIAAVMLLTSVAAVVGCGGTDESKVPEPLIEAEESAEPTAAVVPEGESQEETSVIDEPLPEADDGLSAEELQSLEDQLSAIERELGSIYIPDDDFSDIGELLD